MSTHVRSSIYQTCFFYVDAGGAMATEQMEKKIENNEELQQKLESALSNQEAQKEAYQVWCCPWISIYM